MRLPKTPPPIRELLGSMDGEKLIALISSGAANLPPGRYEHWDKIRYLTPPPKLTREEWWIALKLGRSSTAKKLPFLSTDGRNFEYTLPDFLHERLHRIDQDASGRVELPSEVTNPNLRDRYLISSLFEEAIASSQLEGASTTHHVAKAMLREGRKPANRSEQMIFNNFRAMEFVREHVKDDLNEALLLELHRIVTDGTLDESHAEGRFRIESDEVVVIDNRDNSVLHKPPPSSELSSRLQALCDFANSREVSQTSFIHPVVRSILLHLMIGYDHPFVDGNGRTARALFYWSMARHKYWMMEFVSISAIIRRAPVQYTRAYLYTETDEFDATYFLDYNLRVITSAITKLHQYLARKSEEVRSVDELLGSSDLNHRQIALISHAIKHPGTAYTIESHRKSHGVTYQTARTDLLKLADERLLILSKRGREYSFRSVADIEAQLGRRSGAV